MQPFDNKSSPLKDDLKDLKIRERTLRSASPAIKRPASDMGGQEREDDTKDVDMADDNNATSASASSLNTLPTNNGKRQKSENTNLHFSNPNPVAQTATSKDSSISSGTIPDTTSASTAHTSVMEPADRPTVDEQIAKVTELVNKTPKDGDKGYCVSFKWMKRVLARASDPTHGFDKSLLEGEIGPVDSSDLAMVVEDSGKLQDEAREPFTALRPDLQLGEDFQVLPQQAWDLVTKWYGLASESPIITRYAHALSEDKFISEVQYELYPPIFTLLKVAGTQTAQTQKDSDLPPRRIVSSVHRRFMQWLREAKETVNIDMDSKVRVWKVLGGIKNSSGSGIPTPQASRAASPAPGAEIVANAGSKMILDVNTFSLLTLGDQRELIEHKDQTMDPNYNGKIDLRTIGLGRSDVIVLEEQTAEADKFPSDNPKFSFKGAAKVKHLTASGRSSPTPSIMTRGRAQREGRPKGIVGLQNLGNTCYMNSALQCIRSVDELTEYFRCGYFKKELNPSNPLGHKGEVAKAYGSFIEGVYGASGNTFTPNNLKRIVGKYGPSFAGYGQQDSQEFLAFLLDGLAEDLNRIHKKPYIEKPDSTDEMVENARLLKEFADRNWNDYKARNDSVVTDLFAGMYKSTLTCPVCAKVSIVFDPFTNLTLQLPIENNWAKEIVYFPIGEKPMRIDVDIDKNASILDMKRFVSLRTKHDPQQMICAESYKNKFFKIFDNSEIIAETSINANDTICMYELADKPTNYNPDKKKKFSQFSYSSKDMDPKVDPDSPAAEQLLTPVYHRVTRANHNGRLVRSFFGHPSYVVLSREDRTTYDAVLKKVLSQVIGMTTLDILSEIPSEDSTPEDSDTLVLTEENGSESPSASGKSIQDEDGIVDVAMRGSSQAPAEKPSSRTAIMENLMKSGTTVPKQLQSLFDINVAHTDEGIPTGWNTLNETTDYDSLKEKAAEASRALAHRPKRSFDDETYDSSADELAGDATNGEGKSVGSGSESGGSPRQESDADSMDLPEPSQIFGKDNRGASKHQKKKTYSRKGKRFVGKAPRKTPPPAPQPKVRIASGHELIVPGDAIILDWDQDSHDALFGGDAADNMRGSLTHKEPELFDDEELAAKRAARLSRKKSGVTLEDCLNEYGKTETLSEQNAWYCPRCKEHRKANKQFELWKVPDILVMHLKRFSSARNFRDKLELKVEYPVEGLDLTHMVSDQSEGKNMVYDLVAVDNHYGGLGGGHYTAYAKNSVNKNWYEYNDSHVSQVKDPEAVVQKSAYLLFYRRRADPPLGGSKMHELLTEVESEEISNSREASPSGEGQRLGDSSHNGSSSASAGQAHHVGGGGLAVGQQKQKMRGLSRHQEGEQESHSMYHELSSSGAQPPDYGDRDNDMLLQPEHDEGIGMQYGPPNSDQSWSFDGIANHWHAPPSSNVDETEENDTGVFSRFGRRNSNVSAANASSTAGLGGSDRGNASDDDEIELPNDDAMTFQQEQRFTGQRNRESAPPPEVSTQVITIPLDTGDEEEELEVQELRIDSEGPQKSS